MITGFITIGILQLLAVISPGPDFALVVKNTLSHSRKTGIFTTLGITSGILFHMTYCILGFALIINQSHILFNIIKYAGAAYLIYIGFKGVLSKNTNNHAFAVNRHNHLASFTAYKQGLFCNMLNPKASLFFLGLFTLVIRPQTPSLIQVLYGLEIMVITFCWFAGLSYMLTHTAIQPKIKSFQHIITKVMGFLLILFGTQLALYHH